MAEQWVLIWLFLVPSDQLEYTLTNASVKGTVYDSRVECDHALFERLDVNDTRYMISHKEGNLVCVQIPPGQELRHP